MASQFRQPGIAGPDGCRAGLGGVGLGLRRGGGAIFVHRPAQRLGRGDGVGRLLHPPHSHYGASWVLENTNWRLSGLLLAVNVVSVNRSAKVTFLVRGIKPRTWLEKQKARQSMTVYIVFWVAARAILMVAIYLCHQTLC